MKKKIKILIIEDDALIAQVLKMELEFENFEVISFVAKGEEAIIEAQKTKPDLLLMDIKLLGDIDGIETAKKINENKKIPLIFITGYSESKVSERIKCLNPIAYLEKPIVIENLIKLIKSIFE